MHEHLESTFFEAYNPPFNQETSASLTDLQRLAHEIS